MLRALALWLRADGRLWSNRDFVRLWSAQTVSQFGSQVTNLALPFVALLTLKATTFEIAALGVVDFLPFALLSLPAGVWVDRLRRRPILIAADWGRAAVLASVPIAYAFGALTLAQLFVVGFLTGTFTVFFDVSYQSYLPSLIEREQLSDGNSKLEISRSAAQVVGPGIAGVLIGAFKAPYAIAIDAASFAASAVLMTRIKRAEARPERSEARDMRREIGEGLRFVLRHPLMRPAMIWVATMNFFTTVAGSILLVFAVRKLHLTAPTVGLVFSLASVGVLAGALFARRVEGRLGVGPSVITFAALGGASWLLVPLADGARAIPFLVASQLIFGFCAIGANIIAISLYQAITPDRMLGRMNASRRFVVWGIMPFAGLIGGALGSYIGLRPTLWIGAVGATFAFLPMVFSPFRHVSRYSDAEALVHEINAEFLSAAAPTPTL